VGGVSERPAQGKRRGAILSRALVATVEGTLIHRMPAAFAGCRTSVGLGRSVSSVCSRSLPLRAVGLATRGCPLVAAGGERRRRTPSVRTRPGKRATTRPMNEDTSFTRSRDPCTSIGTQLRSPKAVGGVAGGQVSRSGKPAKAGGTGTEVWPNGRSAARRASPLSQERSRVMRQKRKVVEAIVPARKRELRWVARTS
jgi:hypothetical protein